MVLARSTRSATSAVAQQTHVLGQLQEAKRLHLADRLNEAEALYEAVLRAQPGNGDAKHLLGFLKHQQGQHAHAIRLLRQALKADRSNAIVQHNLATVLQHVGDVNEALVAYRKTLQLDRTYVDAYANYGGLLSDLRRFEEAVQQLDKALALNRDHVEALNNRGNALRGLGRLGAALADYDRAMAINPTSAGVLFNRGIALHDLGRFEEAVASFDTALTFAPLSAAALNSRGLSLQALHRLPEALASFERALEIESGHLAALCNRGSVLRDLNRYEDALVCYDQAIGRDPSFVFAHNSRGDLLRDLGRFGDARAAFERAMALDPSAGTYVVNLTAVKTFTADDPLIGRLEALSARPARLTSENRAKFGYALGKIHDDCGNHERAFEHYMRGAEAKRSIVSYDEAATMQLFNRIEAVFSADFIAARSGFGDPAARPIFVVGMPRSGTTLVEQILASHSEVFGAGELAAFNAAVNHAEARIVPPPDDRFPECLRHLDPSDLRGIAAEYGEVTALLSSGARHVVDKMPANFFFLGLIHLAFPNARIIHIMRDPLDTCVSCFTMLFSQEQGFSYDLGELGRYFRRYRDLMAHWRRVLPEGTFIDVNYEDIVADLETQTRRILDHCGLPWEDRCLAFHQARRAVRTASAAQVRQPIYDKSIGRWRRYERFLEPLLAALAG